ncbi:MAG: M10 family metallopeptidase C-terminal domain-containing protein, partial [Chlorobiaceae bacterium]
GNVSTPKSNASSITVITTVQAVSSIGTTAPTVTSIGITDTTGLLSNTLSKGDIISVTATMTESVTVDTSKGTPQLGLNIGGTVVQASYASGSGTNALLFTYTIQSTQSAANGISINAGCLSLNGGTITDVAGNSATLTCPTVISGTNGNNTLNGTAGNDMLLAYGGVDTLTGNGGNDTFVFTDLTKGVTAGSWDVITDFVSGQDKIDLSGIDANTVVSGDQAFSSVILGSSSSFSAPGQLLFDNTTGVLYGCTDNSNKATFAIQLQGVHSIKAADIIL